MSKIPTDSQWSDLANKVKAKQDVFTVTVTEISPDRRTITWTSPRTFQELIDNMDKVTFIYNDYNNLSYTLTPYMASLDNTGSSEVIIFTVGLSLVNGSGYNVSVDVIEFDIHLVDNGTGTVEEHNAILQPKLTAGTGIDITNNVISATGGSQSNPIDPDWLWENIFQEVFIYD